MIKMDEFTKMKFGVFFVTVKSLHLINIFRSNGHVSEVGQAKFDTNSSKRQEIQV